MDLLTLIQITETISEQNQSPILIEENLVQNNFPKENNRPCIIQLGSGGYLAIDKTTNYQSSEAQQQKFSDELQELFHPTCEMKNPLVVPRSEISENTINRIRGGGTIREAAGLLITIWMLQQQSVGFQPIRQAPMPPHLESAHNLLFGKPKGGTAGNPQCQSNVLSRFERETPHTMKQMCAASSDENEFVMSRDEAIKLLHETYSGSMQVTEDLRISDWQAGSHLYHGNGVGVDPSAFGMTQAELDKLRGGFINYARKGYRLPSRDHVRAYQTSLKNICLDSTSIRHDDAEYYYTHGMERTTVFQNDRYLVCFNQTTSDLITGDKQRAGTVRKFNETHRIGSQKWIDKWSKE